ncbi:MAG: hypothetical protein KAX49_13050 [Halanaerobiales bacterium]|nr:hypothetical protein [Halanaerobiales bacterium]
MKYYNTKNGLREELIQKRDDEINDQIENLMKKRGGVLARQKKDFATFFLAVGMTLILIAMIIVVVFVPKLLTQPVIGSPINNYYVSPVNNITQVLPVINHTHTIKTIREVHTKEIEKYPTNYVEAIKIEGSETIIYEVKK